MMAATTIGDVSPASFEIPASWAWAELGELGDWYGGATPSKKNPEFWTDGELPWLSPKDMGEDALSRTHDLVHESALESSALKVVPADSIALVVRSGILDKRLPIALVPFPVTLNQDMKSIAPFDGIDPRWLAWTMRSLSTQILASCRKRGTTVSSLEIPWLMRFRVPVPPSNEQERIVEQVEKHLDLLATATRSVSYADDRLRQLDARVLADLTIAHPDAGRWERKSLGEMATISSGATPLKSNPAFYQRGDIPWVTSSQLNQPFIEAAEKFITTEALEKTSVRMYEAGTLLVAMYGEGRTRGKCSELRISSTTNQACAGIELHDEYRERLPWVKTVLEAMYEENRTLSWGGVQPNLSLRMVKQISVALPPRDVQDRLLVQVQERRASIAAMSTVVAEVASRAIDLRSSVLSAAVAGKLTPQRATDGTGHDLLDAIRLLHGPLSARSRRRKLTSTSSLSTTFGKVTL